MPHLLTILRLCTAAVWLVFGLVFKVMHVMPRHDEIVAAVMHFVLTLVWSYFVAVYAGALATLS